MELNASRASPSMQTTCQMMIADLEEGMPCHDKNHAVAAPTNHLLRSTVYSCKPKTEDNIASPASERYFWKAVTHAVSIVILPRVTRQDHSEHFVTNADGNKPGRNVSVKKKKATQL